MDNINVNEETTNVETESSKEMIEKCAEIIAAAIESNNDDRLRGILEACTIDLDMSDEELNALVDTTKRGLNGELNDEEIAEIDGGVAKLPAFMTKNKYFVIGALALAALTPVAMRLKDPIKKNLAKIKDKITGKGE